MIIIKKKENEERFARGDRGVASAVGSVRRVSPVPPVSVPEVKPHALASVARGKELFPWSKVAETGAGSDGPRWGARVGASLTITTIGRKDFTTSKIVDQPDDQDQVKPFRQSRRVCRPKEISNPRVLAGACCGAAV